MLRVVSLGAALVAVLAVLRRLTRGPDALGRKRDFPTITVVLCLAVTVAAGIPVLRHARFERRLGEVASSLSGAEVTVRCQTLSQAWTSAHAEAGYVWFDADGRPDTSATITVDTCRRLQAWAGSDRSSPSLDEIVAVHVLTHEAMHLAGQRDEALAECAAVQRDARTAVLLGATPERARSLARAYWQQVYPRMPDGYRTGACGPGEPLDERTPDAPWTDGGTTA